MVHHPRSARKNLALIGLAAALAATAVLAVGDPPAASRPGVLGRGVTLLPNGWKLAPAGRHIQVGDLPLAMVQSRDGRFVLVATNGYQQPTVTIVDVERGYVVDNLTLDHAWLGMAWHPDGERLYVSGGGNNTVHELEFAKGKLTRGPDIPLGRPMAHPTEGVRRPNQVAQSFVSGVAVSPDGAQLYAVHVLGQVLDQVDLKSGRVERAVPLDAEPYTCVLSPDGSTLFVSLWGAARVLLFDAKTLEPRGAIAVGEHPNAMAVSADGARLFVACANTNAVWAIDVAARRASEQISVALYPKAPEGSTPNHVSLSPDGRTLLVANADNNTVAVVDVSRPGASTVDGFIPTGWYPTAAMFSRDGRQIYVLSGKGLSSAPNPRMKRRDLVGGDFQYIGSMLTGTLSIVPTPDAATLKALTKTVYALTPYSDARVMQPAGAPAASPIPGRVGAPSPIKHVFYVIRENRTYDQVLGDLDRGDGDPTITMFGEEVTPNAHALAREYGVLDNFFVDAEVSYDGHAWSTGAYATDVVEKFWPTNYAGRGLVYLSEGGGTMRNAYGNLAAPAAGYLWDACIRANQSVRSYGEFVHPTGAKKYEASVPGLKGRIDPEYPGFDTKIPDQTRADLWLKEFREFEANGQLPALSIIRLPNDHTAAVAPGQMTPRAMVADNDLALGRIVEAISHSRYWKESAIFVLEDDAQNGPDHVDAHRSPALVISPFSKRRGVDSTLYTTSGMLRTIELILGLPPMSQYDAAATPMYNEFQPTPVPDAFTHLPNRVPLDEKNDWNTPGAKASSQMDLAEADLISDNALNELLWRAVKGPNVPMPPAVRGAFAWRGKPAAAAEDDDDDR